MTAPVEPRRRWTMRVPLADGAEAVVDIQAHDGKVFARAAGVSVEMSPLTAAKLRGILGDAIAAALQQRGQW